MGSCFKHVGSVRQTAFEGGGSYCLHGQLTKGMSKCAQYSKFSQNDAINRKKFQSATEERRAAAEQEQARQYVVKLRRKMLKELYARERREWAEALARGGAAVADVE